MLFKQSLWSLAAALCFSLMGAFVKFCSDIHAPSELVFYRSLFGVVGIFLLAAPRGLSLRTHCPRLHFARSFLGVVSVGIWFYAIAFLPFGTSMTLAYTTPIFLALNFIVLAWLRHTKAPWNIIVTIVLGFIGIVLVMKPAFEEKYLVPALICVASAVIDVPIKWQMKAMGRMGEPSYRIVFYFCLLGTLMAGTYAACAGEFRLPTASSCVGLLGMGLFATLGQWAVTRSYAYGNLLLSACLGFSAIPISAVIGFVWFSEIPDTYSFLGMLAIVVAGVCATVFTRLRELRGHG